MDMKWISVNEAVPRRGMRVIATGGTFVGEAYLTELGDWYRFGAISWIDIFQANVTHWMPMPEPKKNKK